MISIKLDNTIYLRANLTLKQDVANIIIYNDGITVKEIEYEDESTATSKFNSVISALDEGTTFYLDLDTLLANE